MPIATDLSQSARSDLVAFCSEHLRDGADATSYAENLIRGTDLSAGAHFVIDGAQTQSGNPATISFSRKADFVWSEA